MTIYSTIKEKLENFKDFRERRFRGKYLAKLALRDLLLEAKYEETGKLSYEDLVQFAGKYDSFRHEYDAVLRDCPDLRGSDYGDKDKLEQEKMLEFNYSPGHYKDTKMLKNMVK